jgi:hypothetical protein
LRLALARETVRAVAIPRGLGLAVAVLITAGPADAAERARAVLDWRSSAGAGCLEAPVLVRAVEERLHRTVFVPQQADLRVSVAIKGTAGDWSADILLADTQGHGLGHRQLMTRAEHCSALDDSLALVVALMVDLWREDVRPPPMEPASRGETPIRLPRNTVAPREPWHAALFLFGRGSLGELPGVGRGIGLAAEIRPPHSWVIGLGVTAWLPAETSGQPGARFLLRSAELELCRLVWQKSSADLGVCLGQQVGYLQSRAFAFDVNRKEQTLLYNLTLELRGVWWVTSLLGLRLGLGAALPLSRDEFFGTRADGSRVRLFDRAPVAAVTELGLGLRW